MTHLFEHTYEASDALARNDAVRLEEMCSFVTLPPREQAVWTIGNPSDEERSAMRIAVLAFQRQVLAARANVILRERLLATRQQENAPWAP